MLVSRLLVTWHRVGIASGCKDKRVGAALVMAHKSLRLHWLQVLIVEVTSALHPDVRMWEWEWLVGGSLGSDAQPHTSSLSWPSPHTSSSSSVPHALVVPPLCRRRCRPRDTCPTEASSSSGGDVTVVVRPRPCIVGEWERASSLSLSHHPPTPLPSSGGGVTICLCLHIAGEWEGRERCHHRLVVVPPHPHHHLVGASPSPSICIHML